MRILFLAPYTPNLIRTRPYNLIRTLRRGGHDITLLTLTCSAAEEADLDALRDEGIVVVAESLSRVRSLTNSLAAFPSSEPLQAAYCRQPALAARLRVLLAEETFDVVHVEHLRGAHYALLAKSTLAAAGRLTPVVWDSVDCISRLFRQAATHSAGRLSRLMSRLDLSRTERYEGGLVGRFEAVLATSAVERDALAQLAKDRGLENPLIHVLPNGVDLMKFRPDPSIPREPATLVLTGKMSYHANVTMAGFLVREIMPLVWTDRPDARVMIVGQAPPRAVRLLAADSRVTVTGAVPDIRPYLNRATMAVAPIVYGAGIQNKVLEALACGAPVVTTSQAAKSLAVEPGRHLLVADGLVDLASAIIHLLTDPDRCVALGTEGRRYVENSHDWSRIADRLTALYDALLSGRYPLSVPIARAADHRLTSVSNLSRK